MHLAAERGLVEVAEALLEKGGLQLFGLLMATTGCRRLRPSTTAIKSS